MLRVALVMGSPFLSKEQGAQAKRARVWHRRWCGAQEGQTTKPQPGLGCVPLWSGRVMPGDAMLDGLPGLVVAAKEAARRASVVRCSEGNGVVVLPRREPARRADEVVRSTLSVVAEESAK